MWKVIFFHYRNTAVKKSSQSLIQNEIYLPDVKPVENRGFNHNFDEKTNIRFAVDERASQYVRKNRGKAVENVSYRRL